MKKPTKQTLIKITKSIILLILLATIVLSIIYIVDVNNHECKSRHADSFSKLTSRITLNQEGKFTDASSRDILKVIYAYRSKFEYDYSEKSTFISVFNIRKPNTPPTFKELNDISLYKLSMCKASEFSKLMAFVYVFNNENYMKCINAYDPSKKHFNVVFKDRSTRDVIIKDILKFGDADVADIKKSIESQINKSGGKTNVSEKLIKGVINFINDRTDEDLYFILVDNKFI